MATPSFGYAEAVKSVPRNGFNVMPKAFFPLGHLIFAVSFREESGMVFLFTNRAIGVGNSWGKNKKISHCSLKTVGEYKYWYVVTPATVRGLLQKVLTVRF